MCLAISNYALKLPRWCKCVIYPIVVLCSAFFIQQRIFIVAIIFFCQLLQTCIIKISPPSILQTHVSWFDQNSLKRYYQYEHLDIRFIASIKTINKILLILWQWLYNLLCTIFFAKTNHILMYCHNYGDVVWEPNNRNHKCKQQIISIKVIINPKHFRG